LALTTTWLYSLRQSSEAEDGLRFAQQVAEAPSGKKLSRIVE
jgi:hypothetical protein